MKKFLELLQVTHPLKKSSFIILGALAIAASASANSLEFNDTFRGWNDSKYVNDNIRVYVSPKGQKYFRDDLQDFLARNGFSIDRDTIDEKQNFDLKVPFDLEKIPGVTKEFQDTINDAVKQIAKLSNLRIMNDDLNIKASIAKIQYALNFAKLGVVINPNNKLTLTAHLKGAIAEAIDLRATESNSIMLAKVDPRTKKTTLTPVTLGFGIPKVSFELTPTGTAVPPRVAPGELTASLDIDAMLDAASNPTVTISNVKVNSDGLKPALKSTGPYALPRLESSQTTFVFNPFEPTKKTVIDVDAGDVNDLAQKEAKTILEDNSAKLSKNLYEMAVMKLVEVLPNLLKKQLEKLIASAKEEVSEIEPPGVPDDADPADKFVWNAVPTKFKVDRGHFRIDLKTIAEDPKNISLANRPEYSTSVTKPLEQPEIDSINSSDITLELHENFLNRLLHMSFNRGFFEKVKIGKNKTTGEPEFVKLTDSPLVKIGHGPAPGLAGFPFGANKLRIGLNIEMEIDRTFVQRLVIKNPIRLGFDGIVRIQKSDKGGIAVILESLDVSTATLAPNMIKFWPALTKKTVMKNIHERLEKVNEGLKEEPSILASNISLPDTFFGIPLKLKNFKTSRFGSVFVHVEYGL